MQPGAAALLMCAAESLVRVVGRRWGASTTPSALPGTPVYFP